MDNSLPPYGKYDSFIEMFSEDYQPRNNEEAFVIRMFFSETFDIPTLFDMFNNKQLLAVAMKLEKNRSKQ